MTSLRRRPGDDPGVALMSRFQRGDDAAFEELVRLTRDGVINLAYRYLGDSAEAEDLAQEVFLKVYRARATWVPTAKLTTWIYRIVVNLCLNEIRDRKREVVGDPPEEIVAGEGEAGLLAQFTRDEVERAVRGAIQSLPENQRMAVLLVKYEGMSYEEAAETLGVSLEALKSLIFRAKEGLRQKLSRYIEE